MMASVLLINSIVVSLTRSPAIADSLPYTQASLLVRSNAAAPVDLICSQVPAVLSKLKYLNCVPTPKINKRVCGSYKTL